MTTTTGRRAATEPLRLISAVSTAISSIIRTSSRVRLSPACRIRNWPVQAVTPVASSAGADHEQRGDEDHRRIAEPGERLAEVEHARGPERERRRQRHDDHREAVPDEQDDDRGNDRESERDVTQDYGPPPVPASALTSGSLVRPAPGARRMTSPARSGNPPPLARADPLAGLIDVGYRAPPVAPFSCRPIEHRLMPYSQRRSPTSPATSRGPTAWRRRAPRSIACCNAAADRRCPWQPQDPSTRRRRAGSR